MIELGQLLAGPFACTILAYFGAEVIKVEAPTGDPIRGWRVVQDGTSLWYRSLGRNKKSVTLDLKSERGRALVLQLLDSADVLVENFRPGAMEDWGLGPDVVKARNPRLVYARISGYGQTGPYASKPGYASVTEAFGGFRYINGESGKAPVRPNISLGDTVAGLHAALGITLALLQRAQPGGEGQVVDVALYESVFNLLEGMIPEYDGAGVVREPAGTTVTGIVPTNTYHCDDGKYVVIGGNGDAIFKRLMTVAGRSDMAADPELADNVGACGTRRRSTRRWASGVASTHPRTSSMCWKRRACRWGRFTRWPICLPIRSTRRAGCLSRWRLTASISATE